MWVWVKIKQGKACFSHGFRLPGFHFGYPFLTHSHAQSPLQGAERWWAWAVALRRVFALAELLTTAFGKDEPFLS